MCTWQQGKHIAVIIARLTASNIAKQQFNCTTNALPRCCKAHDKGMARAWQEHGKSMARACPYTWQDMYYWLSRPAVCRTPSTLYTPKCTVSSTSLATAHVRARQFKKQIIVKRGHIQLTCLARRVSVTTRASRYYCSKRPSPPQWRMFSRSCAAPCKAKSTSLFVRFKSPTTMPIFAASSVARASARTKMSCLTFLLLPASPLIWCGPFPLHV